MHHDGTLRGGKNESGKDAEDYIGVPFEVQLIFNIVFWGAMMRAQREVALDEMRVLVTTSRGAVSTRHVQGFCDDVNPSLEPQLLQQ